VVVHQRAVVDAAVDRAAASTSDGGAVITDAEAADIQTATANAIAAVTAAVQAEADALCTDTLTAAADQAQGRVVQVDPIKPVLKAPGSQRLRLRCDILLSNYAFKFNLRRYSKAIKRRSS